MLSSAPLTLHPACEMFCSSDSLDEDLATNSLDSIAQVMSLLQNSANGVKPDLSAALAKPLPQTVSPAQSASSASSVSKDVSSMQRQAPTATNRPAVPSLSTAAAKSRPPPLTPRSIGAINAKPGGTTPPPDKLMNLMNKVCDATGQQGLNSKSPQSVTTLLQNKNAFSSHQQGYVTPMQATLTKSSQSSSASVVKLTPRPPAQTTPPGSTRHLFVSSHSSSSTTNTHYPPIATPPFGSNSHLSAKSPPPLGPGYRSPAATAPPSGNGHRTYVLPAPPSSSHRPTGSKPGSALSLSVPITASCVTSASPSTTHCPSGSVQPSISTDHTPVMATGSTHRPSLAPLPPGLAHLSSSSTSSISMSSSVPSSTPTSTACLTQPHLQGFKLPFSPASKAPTQALSLQEGNLTLSSANQGQRLRPIGGASQSNKTSANHASTIRLPTPTDSALLSQVHIIRL